MRSRRSFIFWSELFLRYVGDTILFTLAWMIYSVLFHAGWTETGMGRMEFLGIFLYIGGVCADLILTANFLIIYFPLLLSVNVTRKRVMRGFLGCSAGLGLFVTAGETVLWSVGDLPFPVSALPAFLGLFLALDAVGIFCGVLISRLKKTGIFLTVLVILIITAGIIWAVVGELWSAFSAIRMEMLFLAVCAAGWILFLAAGFFAWYLLKNQEVQR